MLGCVNPASWLLLAAGGGEFTQPSLHLFLHVCSYCSRLTNPIALSSMCYHLSYKESLIYELFIMMLGRSGSANQLYNNRTRGEIL